MEAFKNFDKKYLKYYARRVVNNSYIALIEEVKATPKPGLVDYCNTGAHNDMDYNTFKESAKVLKSFFLEFFEYGYYNKTLCEEEILKGIRSIGIRGEKIMLEATKGVNTHKGALFSLGILCTGMGYLYEEYKNISLKKLRKICKKIAQPLEKELEMITKEAVKTNGEKLYVQYGLKGARGEALSGFQAAFEIGLPILEKLLKVGYSKNDTLILTLLYVMAKFDDTNIVARSNYETLKMIQEEMKELTKNDTILKKDYKGIIRGIDERFIKKNISPGGSADILIITNFLYLMKFEE